MLDFVEITERKEKNGSFTVEPEFINDNCKDIVKRGGTFYACWDEERGMWSKNLNTVYSQVDKYVRESKDRLIQRFGSDIIVNAKYMRIESSGMAAKWKSYIEKHYPYESDVEFDSKLVFASDPYVREDYSTHRLPYDICEGDTPAYDTLMSVIYEPKERHKLEWVIGAILTGESRYIQKFIVLYGKAGCGKSTWLHLVEDLFSGYWEPFVAKDLGSSSAAFGLSQFSSNPLVAIQHDGDLSKIEDNTKLNSITSHETMLVNEKFKKPYEMRFNSFLMMGTNSPVKITDAQSGLIRRLIDVYPTGKTLPGPKFREVKKQLKFELGAIANHCIQVFEEDPHFYDDYRPTTMIDKTYVFYDFITEYYDIFMEEDPMSLKRAWDLYSKYAEYTKLSFPFNRTKLKEELKYYYDEYLEETRLPDGSHIRKVFRGFNGKETFKPKEVKLDSKTHWLDFTSTTSLLDDILKDCPAQYAKDDGSPKNAWDYVETTLKDISTSELHYVRVPENHIVIDFDVPGPDGKKDLALNLQAVKDTGLPPTYAELSKSGAGIHLHYIYTGDVSKLSRILEDHIEIKVYTGKSALRRRLSKCNDIQVREINSGLPIKEEVKTVNFEGLKNDKALHTFIRRNLAKEYPPHATVTSVQFIYDTVEKMYADGIKFDIRDMYKDIIAFANNSTNNRAKCLKLVAKMHLHSEDADEPNWVDAGEQPYVIFDCEVFPNFFCICWKYFGLKYECVKMINPSPEEVERFLQSKLIGFNNRDYDNHMCYARAQGFTNRQIFDLSQRVIEKKDPNAKFSMAYGLSETDVYDFASAGNKMSLKKWEIELGKFTKEDLEAKGFSEEEIGIILRGRSHIENSYPWDQDLPEEHWEEVANYCCNDVYATEAVFVYLKPDWLARQILADLAGGSVNDKTNTLTTKIIFGSNKHPQGEFMYRDMSKPVYGIPQEAYDFLCKACPDMMAVEHGDAKSILPYFPGYKYENGHSVYKGIEVGEGGYAKGIPGVYGNVALLDIASMHPHSIIAECLFGVRYTTAFRDIVEGRVSIKHKAWDEVNDMLDGKLVPYIQRVKNGEFSAKDLANALKTAINSVYGLTAAKFDNPFRDPRNVDNIVAKRGALFMVDLIEYVRSQGFEVCHVKTDSIKIPDATDDIIQKVMDFGKRYGYTFEHEATYDRMCLLNDAVYIAKGKTGDHAGEWTPTGKQFMVPYVFKTLFSKEPIVFEDMCEAKSVKAGEIVLDMNEGLPDGEHNYKFVGRIGNFVPMKPGYGGGYLYRHYVDNGVDKYASITGTKKPDKKTMYRWLEAEVVKNLGLEDGIDKSYYQVLVDDAASAIDQYADVEWFCSDVPYDRENNGILPF